MGRAIWKGAFSFGPLNIPVKLSTAVKDDKVEFRQLCPDCNARVRLPLICTKCGREVSRAVAKKGFELAEDKYVVIEPSELENLSLKTLKVAEIQGVIPLYAIDPIQIEHHYYCEPEKGGEKAYSLIWWALNEMKLAMVVLLTSHGKEHLGVVWPRKNGVLVLSFLYYQNEVLTPPQVPQVPLSEREKELVKQLFDGLGMEPEKLSQYRDRYWEAVRELVNAKLTGQPLPQPQPEKAVEMELEKALMVAITTTKKKKSDN
ncbi:MAG: Ku protein [Candidatus Hadarchaeales archaeon]